MQLGGRWFNPRVNLPRHRPLVCGLSLEVDITAGAVLIVLEPEEILIWIYLLKLDFNQLWACNFGSQELGSSSCSPRGHTVELIRTCFPALILTCCAFSSIRCTNFWFCLKKKRISKTSCLFQRMLIICPYAPLAVLDRSWRASYYHDR